MERKVKRLFVFHSFEKNNKLTSFIDDVEKRCVNNEETSLDDELMWGNNESSIFIKYRKIK